MPMWSHKTRYALRALIALSSRPGVPVSVRDAAERYEIPQKYLEAILADLRAAGLVRSTRGPRGGYLLGRSPEHISVEDVLRVVDPEFLAVESSESYETGTERDRSGSTAEDEVLRELSTPILQHVRDTSLADAVRLWQGRRQVLDYVI
jgi:Rrf2 family protein